MNENVQKIDAQKHEPCSTQISLEAVSLRSLAAEKGLAPGMRTSATGTAPPSPRDLLLLLLQGKHPQLEAPSQGIGPAAPLDSSPQAGSLCRFPNFKTTKSHM